MIRFKLKELLDNKPEMTMYKLTKLSGVRPNTINQWYHNETLRLEDKDVKSITVSNLNAVCKVLGCKLEDVIEYVDDKEEPTQ